MRLPCDAKLAERRADRVEGRDDLVGAGQQEELAGILLPVGARAGLKDRRGRIGRCAGIDLDGVDRVHRIAAGIPRVSKIFAQQLLSGIDRPVVLRASVAVLRPAIFRIQAVGQQDDHPVVGGVGIFGRSGNGSGLEKGLPGPCKTDRLVGAPVGSIAAMLDLSELQSYVIGMICSSLGELFDLQ